MTLTERFVAHHMMYGSSSGSRSLRMFVGIGSKEHDLDFDDIMSRWTSSRVSSRKALNSEVAGGSLVKGGEPPVD